MRHGNTPQELGRHYRRGVVRRGCWALCTVSLPVLPLLFRAAGGALRCLFWACRRFSF